MAVDEVPATPGVAGGSRVRLYPLSERRDGEGWVIGRVETGEFITVPDVAQRVIALLGEGYAVDDVMARLRAETGTRFAVADFVAELDGLGFVAAVDDHVRADMSRVRPSLPWLRPTHVRWLLHPLVPLLVAGFAVAAILVLVRHPGFLPSYRVLVWSNRAGLVLAVNAAIAWTIILVHEDLSSISGRCPATSRPPGLTLVRAGRHRQHGRLPARVRDPRCARPGHQPGYPGQPRLPALRLQRGRYRPHRALVHPARVRAAPHACAQPDLVQYDDR
jgi:hypothetical protein